jgi:uncharacterized protein YcbK (DUF882 family)
MVPRSLRNLHRLVAGKPAPALRIAGTVAATLLALTLLVRPTQDVVANGETRSLRMVNMHTGEKIDVAYMRQGRYDQDGLKKLNWFLRDWRRNESTRMDPRMLDTVWMAYRQSGAREPINVVCGYRAPATNALLRRRSRGVAKFSQHTLGKAMDYYIPGVSLATLRAAGLRLQRGGVGYYPSSGSPFVHMDAGSVRMWPRMTRQQLAAVFPDGKTVHIPSDGKPMPGYQAAFAELRRGGGSVGGFQGGGEDDAGAPASGSGFGLASLFGGSSTTSRSSSAKPESTYAVLMADKRRGDGASPAAAAPQAVALAAAPEVTTPAEPAPIAPVVVARADIPLPEPRPTDAGPTLREATLQEATLEQPRLDQPKLDQPKLAWQTGPSATIAPVALAAAAVPLPPSRPGQAAPAAQADAVQLASVNETGSVLPPATGKPQGTGKPQVLEPSAPVMSDVSRSPEALFSRDGTSPTTRALGYAAAELSPPPAPKRRAQGLVATRFEDLDFASVSAPRASAGDAAQAGLTRPDLNSVATLITPPAKVVVIRFGLSAYQDLRPGRFTGAAIRPLKTASIVGASG